MGLQHQTQIGSDWLTHRSALKLAKVIEGYWAARGYGVRTRVELVPRADHGKFRDEPLWQVRSDLVNGLPQDYRDGRRL